MTVGVHDSAPASGAAQTFLPEIGYYAISRHPVTPGDLVGEARIAEQIGLGTAFVSERFNVKDAAVLSGALGAATRRMGIATAATNHNTRHPIITATMGATMAELTGGRFALGLGRGIAPQWQILGLDAVTAAQLTDITDLLRRLWRGEMIIGHEGPAGRYPILNLGVAVPPPPIMIVTMSRRTLELAGRIADGVVLHTFLDDAATTAAVRTVRSAAEQAGRDPRSVRIWSVVATVADDLDDEERMRRLYGRLATYLQGYPDALMTANRWDRGDLDRIRATSAFIEATGPIDATATPAQLADLAAAIPQHWIADSAVGSATTRAATIAAQFDLGVDSVILHGATPTELVPDIDAYRACRPPELDDVPANPGAMSVRT